MATINEIGQRLNKLASRYPIHELQVRRKEVKGLGGGQRRTLFENKEEGKDYAFHYGGRGELQYNIGLEREDDGKPFFRYGLALSFEPSRNVPEPVTALSERAARLNQLIADGEPLVMGLHMGIHGGRGHERFYENVGHPRTFLPKLHDFVFLGQYIEKELDELTDVDLRNVLQLFSDLMPIYEVVELQSSQPPVVHVGPGKEATARVCFNTNGWQGPSGPDGKSRSLDAHERIHGFGFEEWLFDFDRLIDGYHYGHLTPILHARADRLKEPLRLQLYTHNSRSGEWLWVGRIDPAIALSEDEAQSAWSEYERRGWVAEMCAELDQHADREASAYFRKAGKHPINALNVRFKPEDAVLFDGPGIPFSDRVDVEKMKHYQLYHGIDEDPVLRVVAARAFAPNVPDPVHGTPRVSRTYREGPHEFDALHEPLKHAFHAYLNRHWPDSTQSEAGFQHNRARVDLKFRNGDGSFIYYEVKTYASPIQSLRVAIGQLLEYACYWGSDEVKEFVVVSHAKPVSGMVEYMRLLRDRFGLRIGYVQFDGKAGRVLEQINCEILPTE